MLSKRSRHLLTSSSILRVTTTVVMAIAMAAVSRRSLTSYTISLNNERGANAQYAIFMELPEFANGDQSWMNVWRSESLPNETLEFTAKTQHRV